MDAILQAKIVGGLLLLLGFLIIYGAFVAFIKNFSSKSNKPNGGVGNYHHHTDSGVVYYDGGDSGNSAGDCGGSGGSDGGC